MRIQNNLLFSSEAVSGTNAYNSSPIFIGHIYGISFQAVFTGTMTGSMKLQVSNDFGKDEISGAGVTNWTDLGSAVNITSAGSFLIEKDAIHFRWARLVYTNATDSGVLSARVNIKGV